VLDSRLEALARARQASLLRPKASGGQGGRGTRSIDLFGSPLRVCLSLLSRSQVLCLVTRVDRRRYWRSCALVCSLACDGAGLLWWRCWSYVWWCWMLAALARERRLGGFLWRVRALWLFFFRVGERCLWCVRVTWWRCGTGCGGQAGFVLWGAVLCRGARLEGMKLFGGGLAGADKQQRAAHSQAKFGRLLEHTRGVVIGCHSGPRPPPPN
jgi:hypothetical protein